MTPGCAVVERPPSTPGVEIPAIDRHAPPALQRRARRGLPAVFLVALVAVSVTVSVQSARRPTSVTASSSDARYPAAELASAAPDPGRALRWRSDGETVGASVTARWSSLRTISHIAVRGAADPTLAIRGAYLTFSDGSSLNAQPDTAGDIAFSFTARTVDWATLTVTATEAAAPAVGLSSLQIFGTEASTPAPVLVAAALPNLVGTASSSAAGSTPTALVDGARTLTTGRTGNSWTSGSGSEQWAQVGWSTPREIASVQLYGSPNAAGAVSSGRLEFSNGSTVEIAGVASGGAVPATIAFMPRIAISVRFVAVASGPITLREIAVFQRGETPPARRVTAGQTATPLAASRTCTAPATPNSERSRLRLICPAPGSQIGGVIRVVVAAPPSSRVVAKARATAPTTTRNPPESVVAEVTASTAGYAVLDVDSRRLLRGPATLRVSTTGVTPPLHVQLFNPTGRSERSSAPAQSRGMTLAWAEEFRSPLSISRTGRDAVYAATKPSYYGPSDFGSAIFADPAWGTGNLGTIGGEYLRIRVSDRPAGVQDPFGYNRSSVGGIVSSAAVGGSGFSAQYGYFEARMLGAPGLGTWPAFWALSSKSQAVPTASTGEVDTVELYGHDMAGSCHAIHNHENGRDDATVDCRRDNGISDWALAWHTYGARVTPSGTTFHVDGREVSTLRGLINADQPYFFMVNLAMGGGWPTDLTATGGISDLYVDYVRVYT